MMEQKPDEMQTARKAAKPRRRPKPETVQAGNLKTALSDSFSGAWTGKPLKEN